MNTRQCLALAERMDSLLRASLGCGVQPQRMLTDALHARDVLLVCDAHAGSELQALARDWRAARADGDAASVLPGAGSAASVASAGSAAQGQAQGTRSAPGGRPPAAPAQARAGAAPAARSGRAAPPDAGLSSFFDRFRASGPASLPTGRSVTGPLTLGLDGPDTWPPEADEPLPGALDPGASRPLPAPDAVPVVRTPAARRAWFSPARWFDRGAR
jgi:hypothetical protein